MDDRKSRFAVNTPDPLSRKDPLI